MRVQIKLGDLLVKHNVITLEQLQIALKEQKKNAQKLGRVLIALNFASEDEIQSLLSQQLNIPLVHLQHYRLKPEKIKLLPEKIARRYQVIVIDDLGTSLLLGMTDPSDLIARDELQRLLKKKLRYALVKEADLLNWLNKGYRKIEEISSIAVEFNQEMQTEPQAELPLSDEDAETPIMKIIESILKDAIQMGASDVHIEPDQHLLRIRQRVDGVLHEHTTTEVAIAPALILRLKLMAKLNIAEKRLPQDGRFTLSVANKLLDIRLSTMPIQYGESAVLRLLESEGNRLELKHLGMSEILHRKILYHITRPHGVVIVTGPTGSGKTTTLYGCLTAINSAEKKIITVEDPIEYSIERVNQIQVQTKIDLTFSRILKATLRQDPDIIMVGEMRDIETAAIAMRAAITGHLVLSTLHANDAITTAIRLIDMGIEPFLVATALRAVIAQRLIRKVCNYCKTTYLPTKEEQAWLKHLAKEDLREQSFVYGKGCQHCNQIGYKGRTGVYELLELRQQELEYLRAGKTSDFSRTARNNSSYQPLALCALDKAKKGITSIQEVFRLADELEEH